MDGQPPGQAPYRPDQNPLPLAPPWSPPSAREIRIAWAVPEPPPVSRRRLIAGWLARRPATPLAKVVAVGSAAGWVAAAAVYAWTFVCAHALSAVTRTQPFADMALALIDGVAVVAVWSRKSTPSDTPSRATRKAMRRAQSAASRRPGTRASIPPLLQVLMLPYATASLPRWLRGPLAAGVWVSGLACAWSSLVGLGAFGASDASVQDQRFVASIWMLHLIAWCLLACRRLSLRRSDQ